MSGCTQIMNENPLLRHFDDRKEEESPRVQGDFSVAALPRNDAGEPEKDRQSMARWMTKITPERKVMRASDAMSSLLTPRLWPKGNAASINRQRRPEW